MVPPFILNVKAVLICVSFGAGLLLLLFLSVLTPEYLSLVLGWWRQQQVVAETF